METMKVLLASPRGFCAGVNMAIESLELALEAFGPPIYVYHEIVHNQYVVEPFPRPRRDVRRRPGRGAATGRRCCSRPTASRRRSAAWPASGSCGRSTPPARW